MKKISAMLGGFVLMASFGLSTPAGAHVEPGVKANKNVVHAHRLGTTNYCNLKFTPVDRATIDTGQPQQLNPMYKILVDFYGPCDYDPLGEVEIERQKHLMRMDQQAN